MSKNYLKKNPVFSLTISLRCTLMNEYMDLLWVLNGSFNFKKLLKAQN